MINFFYLFLVLVLAITIGTSYTTAQNQRRTGLTQLEFDQSKTQKPSPTPAKALNPTDQILNIMNNQKQINGLKAEPTKKEPLVVEPETPAETPKKKRGIGQLD